MKPKLRFNDFSNEWEEVKLDDLYTFKNGINGDKTLYGKGIELISVSDILNNNYITHDVIKGKINIDDKILKENSVEYGDILFQRSSETFLEIGSSNVYLDDKVVTYGGFVIRGKKLKSNNNNPMFINFELKSPSTRKKIILGGAGSQHFNIGQEELKKVSIFLPNTNEQNKIADVINLLDKKIELQTKKIEDLKLFKLYTKNKLFSNGDKNIKLKDILIKWNEKNKDCSINYVESISNKYGFISQSHQFEDRNVASKDLKNYYVIRKNVFGYNPSRLNVGSLALKENDNTSVVSPLYECFTTTQSNKFMLEWFDSKFFKKGTLSKFEGGVRNTLNFTNLCEIEINLPNLDKQNKYASYLYDFDKKIQLEKNKLDKLSGLKKGLMQNMFV